MESLIVLDDTECCFESKEEKGLKNSFRLDLTANSS
jgi:hypothetical protein